MRSSDPILVTEPKDWFECLLVSKHAETVEKYNALTEEQKEAITKCFDYEGDGTDWNVFRNVGSANGWIGEVEDDEVFAVTKDKIEKVVAGF